MPSRRPTTPKASGPGRKGPSASARRPTSAADGGSRRPAPAARPRAAPKSASTTTPRALSRRAAVIAVLLLVVAAAMAPALRDFINQQADMAALEREVADREQRVAALADQLERWEDPAFVAAQARQRFGFGMPGEVGYVVLDEPVAEVEAADPTAAAAEEAAQTDRAWFGSLYDSLALAGSETGGRPPGAVGGGTEPLPAPSP
ncbi:MAG TPA: septum formation initiator family protein [Actinomycetales bacterium]|nr:septum formation initiator family protein [Actinomycetales bacterium]